jgi:hypothetical protein
VGVMLMVKCDATEASRNLYLNFAIILFCITKKKRKKWREQKPFLMILIKANEHLLEHYFLYVGLGGVQEASEVQQSSSAMCIGFSIEINIR